MFSSEAVKIGELLVEASVLTEAQLRQALKRQKGSGKKLGAVIMDMNLLTKDKIVETLAKQLEIKKVSLSEIEPSPALLNLVPESTARKYRLIPLKKENGKVIVAMADPANIFALDEIAQKLSCDVTAVVGSTAQIDDAINRHYSVTGFIQSAVRSLEINRTACETAPVAKLLESLITRAVADRASDIHIEPDEDVLIIRTRIDGVLFAGATLPKKLQSSIISRVKVISGMDIAETRTPQDGRFKMAGGVKEFEFRVSTFPTIYGENVVIRIMRMDTMMRDIADTGLSGSSLERAQKLFRSPFGIVVVTGPTGSGKTSTLYAALSVLNKVEKNIITIEDPVEYRLKGVRQSQVNVKAGLDFATSMRSMLRQDPDIMMVGEIRDGETAEIAVRAAVTGHLVLSTLHTNDAASAVTRLTDLGIEPYLISSSLAGVIAQRLVRRICQKCKKEVGREEALKLLPELEEGTKICEGTGCMACKKSGYFGRTGIFETLVMDEELKFMVAKNAHSSEITSYALSQQGMTAIREDGLDKVFRGITTLGEVKKVTSGY